MRWIHSWCLVPVGIAAIVLIQAQVILADQVTEINEVAEKITVHINSQQSGSGSGIFIKRQVKRYSILTAAHVVSREDFYSVETPDHRIYPIESNCIYRIPGTDLAILQFDSEQSYSVADIGDSTRVKVGAANYVAGFSGKTVAITEAVYQFTIGKITANASKPLADGYALVYSNNTLPGMSGGPVLNASGELIGIHGRADTTDQVQNPEINPYLFVKTGFNLGIPINTFLSLVPKTTVQLNLRRPKEIEETQTLTEQDTFLQGVDRARRQDYKEAIAKFDQTIKLKANYPDAYFNRGVVRSQIGDLQGALQDYDQAIQLNPNFAEAYFNRAVLSDRSGNSKGASTDYAKAIHLKSGFSEAYYNFGILQYESGDFQGAIANFDRAIRFKPDFAAAYYNQGMARYKLKDLQGAIAAFSEAISVNSNDPDAYYNRGSVRAESRDPQGAIADFQKAAALYQKEGDQNRYQIVLNILERLINN